MAAMISSLVLEKLVRYDTPTICNVIELFEVRPNTSGYMDGRIRSAFPEMAPMVGIAATATFRSAAVPQKGSYVALEAQVEQFATLAGPSVVVFQDLDDPPVGATFGEVMQHVQGVRLGGTHHVGRRARSAAGEGARLSGIQRVNDLLARLLPNARSRPPGPRRR